MTVDRGGSGGGGGERLASIVSELTNEVSADHLVKKDSL